MKTMKKIFALALALVMVMALATTAFADETYTITLNNAQPGHTYTAYQIFAGDLSDSTLSNIVWGTGVSAEGQTALGNAAELAETLEDAEDAEAFAAQVAPYLATAAGSVTIGEEATSGKISGLAAGYYLVKTTGTTEENGVYTYYIMKVVKDTAANIKADVPKVDKEVDDDDVNIGDTVTFTLTGTMPSTLAGYATYKVVFHDTLSTGLTYTNNVKVTIDGTEVTEGYTANHENGELTVSFADVLTLGAKESSTIVVTYTAVLNENAVIGTEGNPNTVYLEYSNDPNWDGEGDEPTGDTPEDEVKVYTWDMEVLKYADSDETNVLEGVKFILLNSDKSKIANVANGKIVSWDAYTEGMDVTAYELTTDANGKISIDGLESGTYYLRETQELPGYNKLNGDVTVTVNNNDDGTYATYVAKVNNQSGATLPETGGIGTTMFYIIGGILVLAAVVLLVTKKRMSNAA